MRLTYTPAQIRAAKAAGQSVYALKDCGGGVYEYHELPPVDANWRMPDVVNKSTGQHQWTLTAKIALAHCYELPPANPAE